MWGIGASFYLAAVFHRMALGVAGLSAEQRLGVGQGTLATFTAVQFGIYLAMQVPAGLAADRIGPRRTLAAGLLFMAAGETMFAFAGSLPVGLSARALIGLGDALVLINVLRLASAWLPARLGSLVATLTGAVGALGQLFGTVPLRYALEHWGWTATFTASAALTGLLFAVAVVLVRDRPTGVPAPTRAQHLPILATLAACWARPGTRHGFWVHLALFCPFQVVGALWGVPFLVHGQGLRADEAATYLLVLTLAFALSGPVVGALAGRGVRAQNAVVVVLNVVVLVPWVLIVLWPGGTAPHALLLAGFAACGLAASGGMVAFDIGRRENPALAAGSATALVNCGGFLSAILCLELVGVLLGGHTGAGRYQVALAPMVVLSFVGLVQSVRLGRVRTRFVASSSSR